jgi:hypothetical protein
VIGIVPLVVELGRAEVKSRVTIGALKQARVVCADIPAFYASAADGSLRRVLGPANVESEEPMDKAVVHTLALADAVAGQVQRFGAAHDLHAVRPGEVLESRHELIEFVVFIEHDIASVRQVADSVVVMDEGKIIAQGKPGEVLVRPEIMEAYVG